MSRDIHSHVVRLNGENIHFGSHVDSSNFIREFGGEYLGTYYMSISKYPYIMEKFRNLSHKRTMVIDTDLYDSRYIRVDSMTLGSTDSDDDAKCLVEHLKWFNTYLKSRFHETPSKRKEVVNA